MSQKKTVIGVTAFFLVCMMLVGYFALAADIGDKTDPLVTVSYIKALEPQIQETIRSMVQEEAAAYITQWNSDLAAAYEQINKLTNSGGLDLSSLSSDPAFIQAVAAAVAGQLGGTVPSGGTPATFTKVVVPSGKTVTLNMGTQMLLRLGSATCVASSSPGLIDLTDGSVLAGGGALLANHLYTVTVEGGRGFKAANEVTVFIMGGYTIN